MNRNSRRYRAGSIFALGIGLAACASGGGTTGEGSGGDNGSAGSGGENPGGTGGSQSSTGGSGNDPTTGGTGGGTGGTTQAGGSSGAGQGGTVGQGGSPAASGGSGGKAAPAACGGRPYCEDFETLAVGARPPGAAGLNRATMGVAEDKAFSGTRSLKITAQAGGASNANWSVSPGAKLTDPKKIAYARLMIWMDQLPLGVAGDSGHWGVVSMQGAANNGTANFQPRLRFGGGGGNQSTWLYYGSVAGGAYDCGFSTVPNQLPLKKWSCVEMVINENDLYNYVVNIDGLEVAALSVIADQANFICSGSPATKNWYIPKPTSFTFGWEYVHTQGQPVTVYIDDVIIDQKPIGCPAGAASKP